MSAQLLEVDAKAVKFICELKKQSTSSVHLSNISDQYVAFKVKTTSPKKYCVRPNSGIISPKSTCDFTVTRQPLKSVPTDAECKDKFLIQSTAVDPETTEDDVTADMFSKASGRYVEERKLKVILVIQHISPDQVPTKESKAKDEKLTTEEPKPKPKPELEPEPEPEPKPKPRPSGDHHDENEPNQEYVKPNSARILKLCNELKDLKSKAYAVEHELKEAKATISNITYQNSAIIEAKATLEQELARISKKGFSFLFVCLVSLIGLTSGYLALHP